MTPAWVKDVAGLRRWPESSEVRPRWRLLSELIPLGTENSRDFLWPLFVGGWCDKRRIPLVKRQWKVWELPVVLHSADPLPPPEPRLLSPELPSLQPEFRVAHATYRLCRLSSLTPADPRALGLWFYGTAVSSPASESLRTFWEQYVVGPECLTLTPFDPATYAKTHG